MPELRFEAPDDEVGILDGYCQATGKSRTDIMRELLRQWSAEQIHVATIIMRMANRKPVVPEPERK